MQAFAELYRRLDETKQTSVKVAAMQEYFARAAPADGAWAVFFLCGRRLKRLVKIRQLVELAAETAEIPEWLFAECYEAVGDLAETIALLLPRSIPTEDRPLHRWVRDYLQPLSKMGETEQRELLLSAWQGLTASERLIFNKLVTGSFRVGVSQRLVIRALAAASGLDPALIAHRLMGDWEPTPAFYAGLFAPDTGEADSSRPYPFCLAHPLGIPPHELGPLEDWQLEWKWDGIRAQLIRRRQVSHLWSRGEEPILQRFPEIEAAAARLPDGTVLDGEMVGWKDGRVLPFGHLQRRIGRKQLGPAILRDVPVAFIAFDLLEEDAQDIRQRPLRERRRLLEERLAELDSPVLIASPTVAASSWEELAVARETSREQGVEGLMIKRRDSAYGVGRVTGIWWKWKIDPYTCDAVLIYAQRGQGRRASLYTDYTFGAWHQGQLVPFAKAYSGLTDDEIREVDRFVRQHTRERFGPVRAVDPELVFELAFEDIRLSSRHKSGIAVRFPRIARWRRDKTPAQADSLDSIKALITTRSLAS